jgi:hypothetical protein
VLLQIQVSYRLLIIIMQVAVVERNMLLVVALQLLAELAAAVLVRLDKAQREL